MEWNCCLRAILAVAAGATLAGCASTFTAVAPAPPDRYSVLGKATGSACGSLGILSTDANFIPMGLNSRVERAYQRALASVPGATGLVNVTLHEDWMWWVIGTARCVTVSGEAVK
jgi:hypothetical protein